MLVILLLCFFFFYSGTPPPKLPEKDLLDDLENIYQHEEEVR